uniref:Mitochondrial ribonuclease P catalytic subunit n=1 Tax=Sphenodon punctatus TaxID=8508 RepID=A0A8D0HAF3_SPHPU
MAFFQTSHWGLQTLLRQYRFSVSRDQQFPAVIRCFSFTISSQSTTPIDPKAIRMWATKIRNVEEGRRDSKGRARKDTSAPHPFSMFSAGASKRRAATIEDLQEPLVSRKSILEPPKKPLSAEEWGKLKEEFKGVKFEEHMFNQMIKMNSSIDVAKSLLTAVAMRSGDVGYSLFVKYLTLCVQQEQTGETLDIHDILKVRFNVLETGAYSLLIRGLSSSHRWREALPLLEEVKKVITPSKRNYGDCIKGALNNQEITLACDLYHEMLAMNVVPKLDTLQAFFDTGKGLQDDKLKSELTNILLYLRDNQVYPGEALMQSIKHWFESIPGENWKGHLTTIQNSRRQCSCCDQYLESIHLSQEEYSTLKDKIINDVIRGMDTFRKTTPQELQKFQIYLERHPPYDVVIDGLNVGNAFKGRSYSQTLLDVVCHLAEQNLRLLVLGRKHMMNNFHQWKRHHMAAMQNKADFFFAENMSEDDPFLLYATLHSGKHSWTPNGAIWLLTKEADTVSACVQL